MKFLSKKSLSLFLILAIVFACNQEEEPQLAPSVPDSAQSSLIPQSELDQLILKSIQETGDFVWMDQTDEVIWSALVQSDSILTIGYQPASTENINARMGEISVGDPQWSAAAQKVIFQVNESRSAQGRPQLRINNQDADIHEDLPFLEMKVADIQVLRDLRLMEEVRYYEPLSYEFDISLLQAAEEARIFSDSGCSNDPNANIPGSDFSVIAPNAVQSWNYPQMGISQAWSTSTGAGVTVGIIDTGVSSSQSLLGSAFSSGASTNRQISKFGTYQTGFWWWKRPDGPNDRCGHGTAMSGVIASPRNNLGAAVGVAYNSNLVSVRGTSDVIVNSGNEKDGVADALVLLGKRSDVKIISMSIGDVFSNSKVADAVRYAHSRGKLIFAAAGTSTSFTNWVGVIFPASMPETVAVTGVKEGSGYQRCDTCHSGSQVEFTVVMERAGSENKPLTTAQSGNTPSTVGGSSVATATAAGIAALVWERYPNFNRDQILQKMRESSDLYPNKSSQYGYGNLNAAQAVGIF
ncbi:S8 family peptidase [Algoriphagus sediminis]|uniref:S8 family serine peptidase n=1 Tax=Algoriphagus sediminis TaxID=3057113 RepID=A0ABT7YDF3_9BACT|nr:S8 family serine peptidase [Algoriphagus sediminis]MDN3204561.1 S8 family serine peptidase [Algoriphagus sediminis]